MGHMQEREEGRTADEDRQLGELDSIIRDPHYWDDVARAMEANGEVASGPHAAHSCTARDHMGFLFLTLLLRVQRAS